MRILGRGLRVTLAALLILTAVVTVVTQPSVLPKPAAAATIVEGAHDDLRTGWYPDQPDLSPDEVTSPDFGQIFDHSGINGQVYAQPLVANGVLLVVTETNWIYGLDPLTGAQSWGRQLRAPYNISADTVGSNVPGTCPDLQPSVGITSTPIVVDNVMYLTAKGYVTGTANSDGNVGYWLYAINIATGATVAGFPVQIPQNRVADNDSGGFKFLARYELQRTALLYQNGVVYAGFGSHCDVNQFRGWVVGMSATNGAVTTMWTSAASAFAGGGIWQSGSGLMSDGPGRIFVSTGNGVSVDAPSIPATAPPDNCSECVLRLQVNAATKKLSATNFFQPYDEAHLDSIDADFASGGPVELPDSFGTTGADATPPFAQNSIVAVGKEGYVYTLNADDLGGFRTGAGNGDRVLSRLGPDGGVWSKPTVWPGDGGWVYVVTAAGNYATSGSAGFLNAYKKALAGGKPSLSRRTNQASSDAFGFGSSAPVITSSGQTDGSAVLWMVWMAGGDGANAELRAYSAVPDDNGQMQLLRSFPVGTGSKFNPPGVASNRIYVATRDGHVHAFGSPTTSPLVAPTLAFGKVTVGGSKQLNVTLTARVAVSGLSVSGISGAGFSNGAPSANSAAAGATVTIPVTFNPDSTGPRGGTLTVHTDQGDVGVPVNGVGQPAAATLAAGPTALSFGGTDVGSTRTAVVTFANIGGQPLTLTSFDVPAAPFVVSGLPSAGTTLGSNATFSATITFRPTSFIQATSTLTAHSTGGDIVINLSGAAAGSAKLSVTSTKLDYGAVALGQQVSQTFRVANAGGNPLTITRSKPPVGPFVAQTALPEGTTIQPGEFVDLTVSFQPTSGGNFTGTWSLNGDGNSTLTNVTFTGSGVVVPSGMSLMRAVTPTRLVDTRRAGQGPKLSAGQTRAVAVGPGVPAGADARSVFVSVAVVGPATRGYLTVYNCDTARPSTSNVNYAAGATVANLAVATVSGAGTICVFSSQSANIVVDMDGYVSPVEGTRLTPIAPVRITDTRHPDTHLHAGETRAITVAGHGLPAMQAALLNVTAVSPAAAGYLIVYRCGTPRPTASNLNFAAHANIAGLAQVALSPSNQVCIYTPVATHLVVDVEGYFRPDLGSYYKGISPVRAMDTRLSTPILTNTIRAIPLSALGGPSHVVPSNATGVLLNVAIADSSGGGFLTVYPCGSPRPTASALNFVAHETRANLVASKLGSGGVCVYASVNAHVVVDTFAWLR